MRHKLHDNERAEALYFFDAPAQWSRLQKQEVMRWWAVVREESDEVALMHGSGAVALLSVNAGVIERCSFLEGQAAETFLRAHGFPVSERDRARIRDAIRPNRSVQSCLDRAFPRGIGLHPLYGHGQKRWLRFGAGGVLELDVSEQGVATGHRFLTGGFALDAIHAAAEHKRWDVPDYPQAPIVARTLGEARLFVSVQKGAWEESRLVDERLEVLARIPEGRRRFIFSVSDLADVDPLSLGPGASAALDPTELLLFAKRIESDLPDAAHVDPGRRQTQAFHLRQAAAALRQIPGFMPPDSDLPPDSGIYNTPVAEWYRGQNPEFFLRARVLRLAERLDALAENWEA